MSQPAPHNPYHNITDAPPGEPGCLALGGIILLALGAMLLLLTCSYLLAVALVSSDLLSPTFGMGLFMCLALVSVAVPFLGAGSLYRWLTNR